MNKVRFNLQYPNKEQSLIMAIVRGGGKQIKKSTGISIPTHVWDKTKQRCNEDAEGTVKFKRGLKKINKQLNEINNRWSQMGNFWLTGSTSLSDIDLSPIFEYGVKAAKKEVEEEEAKLSRTPTQFFQEYIEKIPTMICKGTTRNISVRTQGHHKVILKRLMSFMEATHTPDSFDVFNESFKDKFTYWAYHIARPGRGYSRNSVCATFSILKIWLNAAMKEGLLNTDFHKSLPTKEHTEKKIALTEDDITALYNLDIPKLMKDGLVDPKSTMEVSRDLFVIGCWTGLRRTDLNRINEALFDFTKNTLTIQTQKTEATVTIPLHPYVRALYAKYNGKFPRLVDKSKSNAHLKELGRLAGLNDMVQQSQSVCGTSVTKKYLKYQCIGFHTARRTFATNLYLKGMPTLAIMSMTGHTTEANFLKYIKVEKEEYAERNQEFFTGNKTAV